MRNENQVDKEKNFYYISEKKNKCLKKPRREKARKSLPTRPLDENSEEKISKLLNLLNRNGFVSLISVHLFSARPLLRVRPCSLHTTGGIDSEIIFQESW